MCDAGVHFIGKMPARPPRSGEERPPAHAGLATAA